MMDFSGRQHIPYNRELFVFLPWEKMSVSHRHGDVLVTHELLFSDGSLEAGGRLGECCFLAGLLEDGFRRFAFVRLEHPDHVLRHSDENPLASFLKDIPHPVRAT